MYGWDGSDSGDNAMPAIMNESILASSNRMWEYIGSDGLAQLAQLTREHPGAAGKLREALLDPSKRETMMSISKLTAPLAPVSRRAFDVMSFGPIKQAISFGTRTARVGSDLIARLPGPFRNEREWVAHGVAKAHAGVELIQHNDRAIAGYLRFAEERPAVMQDLMRQMNDPELATFLKRLDPNPVGATPEETARLVQDNANFRQLMHSIIGE